MKELSDNSKAETGSSIPCRLSTSGCISPSIPLDSPSIKIDAERPSIKVG